MASPLINRFKDSFFYLASSLLVFPLTLLTSPMFAKNLSAKDFAAIGFFSNLQMFLLPIMSLSFYSYYMAGFHNRNDAENDHVLQVLFSFLFVINIFISAASYFTISYYLDLSESVFNAYPMGLIVIISGALAMGLGFYNIRLRFQRKSFIYFVINLSVTTATVLLGLYLVVYFQLGALGKLLPPLVINAILFILFFIKYIKVIVIDKVIIKDALIFCFPLIISVLLSLPVQYVDKFFLERLGNVDEFALYNIADSISGYFVLFSTAILQAFEPDIFKYTGERNKSAIIKLCFLVISILSIGALLLAYFSEYAVDYLTAGRYLGAIKYMQVMVLAKFLEPIIIFLGFIVISLQLTKIILFNKMLMAIFSIPIYLIMIKEFTFLGAAYAKIGIFIIWLPMLLIEIVLRNNRAVNSMWLKRNRV